MRSLVAAVAVALLASTWCGQGVARAGVVSTQRVSGSRLAALAAAVVRHVRVAADETIEPAYPVSDQMILSGRVTLTAGSALVTPAFINVPITIDLDGQFLRQIFVGYRVQQWVRTAVASRDLVPGTVIAASDVRMARVEYNGQSTNGVQALVGRRILSAFRTGQQLSIEETQVDQIVKPGSTVVLIVHDGGVSVVADVTARTGGGLGDEISLFNPETDKAMTGTVVGPDRVELDLGETQ